AAPEDGRTPTDAGFGTRGTPRTHPNIARANARPPGKLQPREHIKFHEVVAYASAGAEFYPVADFFAEGVQGVGGTQAVAAALRVFAARDVAAIIARFYCGHKLHATSTLTFDVYAVNDPDNYRAEGGVGIADNLPGGVAFVDHQHPVANAGLDATVNGDEVTAGLASRVLFLHDQQFLT